MPRPKKSNRTDGRFEIQRVIGYDLKGKAIKKSFYGSSKDEALTKYENFKRSESEKEKKPIPFSEWTEKWLETYKRPDVKGSTFTTTYERPCKNYIIPYFQNYDIREITQIDVKRFLNSITHLSQSSIDKNIICLKGIFEAAIDNDIITKNPCRNLSCKSTKEKASKRTYDKESADLLCSLNVENALYVQILLRLGLRCSELCGLRWDAINLEEETVSITQAITEENGNVYIGKPKSYNSIRKIKIPKDLLFQLKQQKQKEGYVIQENGKYITPKTFDKKHLKNFYKKAEIREDQRLSAHELRHTCGTLLYEETKDVYFVSRFLGHSDIGITTKTYVHSEMQEEKIHITFDK